MTRDYNKQRRDDVRPFSRNSSPSRPGNKQFPRPARPRLNRETVDHAWKSGANTHHADYRTRSSNSSYREPPRNNWRNDRPSEQPPAQYGRRPFGNRQESNQERTPYGSPRSRSFDSDRRNFDNQRSNDRRNYSGGPNRNGARPGFRDNDQGRGYQRRDSGHYDRQPREGDFNRNNRSERNFDQNHRNRPSYNDRQPDTQNPRWRSRPPAQHDHSLRKPQHFNERAPQDEQFEGDYERFGTPEYRRRFSERPLKSGDSNRPGTSQARPKAEERHVTRLPDGRVLKGPRPVQRKNAQFWTEIGHETEDLIDQVNSVPAPTEKQAVEAPQSRPSQKKGRAKFQQKPRTRPASAVARGRRPGAKQKVAKPRSSGPKPSQRGFKWPAP